MTPTRRAVISALASSPALACAPAAAASTGVSPDLFELIAQCEAKQIEANALAEKLNDAHDVAEAAAEAEIAALPHYTTLNSFANVTGEIQHLTTEESASVAMARSILRQHDLWDGKQWQDGTAEYRATLEELVHAADNRDRQITEIMDRHQVKEKFDACCAQFDGTGRPFEPVLEYQSRSLADVVQKIDFIERHDLRDWEEALSGVFADIRRLAGLAVPA